MAALQEMSMILRDKRRLAVWASGVLAALLWLMMAWQLRVLTPGVVALQFAWDPQTFGRIIHVWSPEDLALYRRFLLVDHGFLLAYGAFGWLLATRTRVFVSLSAGLQGFARVCLPLAAALDALENAFHGWLTEMPRFDVPWLYGLSTTCSALKWSLLLVFGALLLWAIAVADERLVRD